MMMVSGMGLQNLRPKYTVVLKAGDELMAVGMFNHLDYAASYAAEQQAAGHVVLGVARFVSRPMFRIEQCEEETSE